jgi:hypothetical protein
MAIKCDSPMAAIIAAYKLKNDGAKLPCVVTTGSAEFDCEAWWAASDADDLDTVPGLVSQIMVIRTGR